MQTKRVCGYNVEFYKPLVVLDEFLHENRIPCVKELPILEEEQSRLVNIYNNSLREKNRLLCFLSNMSGDVAFLGLLAPFLVFFILFLSSRYKIFCLFSVLLLVSLFFNYLNKKYKKISSIKLESVEIDLSKENNFNFKMTGLDESLIPKMIEKGIVVRLYYFSGSDLYFICLSDGKNEMTINIVERNSSVWS